jgi:hypothetical protein
MTGEEELSVLDTRLSGSEVMTLTLLRDLHVASRYKYWA